MSIISLSVLEFAAVILIIVGLFNEKKLIKFENRVIRFFKILRKELKNNRKNRFIENR